MAIFPSLSSGLLTFPFILACVPYPSSTCMINFSKTDTCPISLYPEWLGVVVKTEGYGSVRCRVLNDSKYSFSLCPWSFKLSRVSFPIDIDIFRFFFQTVSVPFLSFLPRGPRTCRRPNHPRLHPRTILYLYY